MGNALISAAPSFDHPLEVLEACHDRINAQCETLSKLGPHLATHGADKQARQAALAVLRYFDTAGKNHHLDEERDLFPQLKSIAPAQDVERVETLIERLCTEHRNITQVWKQLRPMLVAINYSGANELNADLVQSFVTQYLAHIDTEEKELIPLATSLLDATQLQILGHKMSKRRGVHF